MLKYANAVLMVIVLLLAGQFYREMTRLDAADFQSDVAVSDPLILPEAEGATGEDGESEGEGGGEPQEEDVEKPPQFNLAIEFHPQAPFGDWGEPYQEACEEASLLLAYNYVNGISISREKFDEELLEMVAWEIDTFGKYEDTSLEKVALMANEYLGHANVEIVDNPTADQLREYLTMGYPIVAPMSGQDLGNPFFSNEGPVFHALVIRGFEEDGFITNDVGTQHGENFFYPEDVFMAAIHDWDDSLVKTRESMNTGLKRVLVVKP